jgi:hypothetical protein
MRALTVMQPWATLIVIGAKRIETRSWPAWSRVLGETIAIHAGARFPEDAQHLCLTEPFRGVLAAAGHPEPARTLPRGAVLGWVRLRDCCHTEDLLRAGVPGDRETAPLSDQELAFGDYREERWGWVFEQARQFEVPLPERGFQGLWTWDLPAELLPLLEGGQP